MRRRLVVRLAAVVGGALAVTGCAGPGTQDPDPAPSVAVPPSPTASSSSAAPSTPAETAAPTPTRPSRPPRGSVPPPWLGERVLPAGPDGYAEARPTPPELRTRRFTLPDSLPPLPGRGFAARVDDVPEQVLRRSTWRPGCPVAAADLRWVRVVFHGFDDGRHTGELLVAEEVADDVVRVFAALWRARFPIEEMRITTRAELDAPPTGDGNNTGAFVCRPVTGGSAYSQHAYGLAIDVNPFQNPYLRGDLVLPELATAYLDRERRAPGMVRPGGPVVRAFAAIGWEWGGDYRTLKDWQHFSLTGG